MTSSDSGNTRRDNDGAAAPRRAAGAGATNTTTTTTATTARREGASGQQLPVSTGRSDADENVNSLAHVSIFAGLDPAGLRELAAAAHRRTFRAGEVIFHRDDPGQVLYVIRQGKVKIYITSPDGQEVSLAVFGAGDYFGELALLDNQPRSASAVAIEPAVTFALQRTDFINAVMHHPRIAVQVMQVLSHRLRQTDAMIEDLLFLDVHGRVAKKLLELAETHGERTSDGIRINMRLTQGELAGMVGASRESVNKVMGYFTDKHFLTTDKYRVTITRLADLRGRVY